ncbi:hypothetical protein D3C75_1006130 [compost metagenome]
MDVVREEDGEHAGTQEHIGFVLHIGVEGDIPAAQVILGRHRIRRTAGYPDHFPCTAGQILNVNITVMGFRLAVLLGLSLGNGDQCEHFVPVDFVAANLQLLRTVLLDECHPFCQRLGVNMRFFFPRIQITYDHCGLHLFIIIG